MSSAPLLQVDNLTTNISTRQGTLTAVDGVSFDIERGEVFGLVGESGAGKSMTAKSIIRLVDEITGADITEGSVHLNGDNLTEMTSAELQEIRGNEMGMIFQEPQSALNPTLTVGRQITETITLHQDVSKEQAREQAIDLLDEVGIPSPADRISEYPHQFSGGMKQRVLIAIALSCEPDLLIADEPTTALDVTIEAQILDLLADLKDKFDMSVLLITHNLGVIANACDRAGVMYAGDIVETAPVEDLFTEPRHPYTQGLLESIPRLSDERGRYLGSIEGSMTDALNPPQGCRFHPRCPEATEECMEAYPPMETVDDESHQTRCLRWDEIGTKWTGPTGEPRTRPDPGDNTIVEVRDLEKWYQNNNGLLDKFTVGKRDDRLLPFGLETEYVKAVTGVDFTIHDGETLALVGESGCGKSTVAHTVARLHDATAGEIQYTTDEGVDLDLATATKSELRSVRDEIAMLFQDPEGSLNPRQTVAQIIGRPIELYRDLTDTEKEDVIEELLETVELSPDSAYRYPHEFSGGQKQRIAIARALAADPSLLIADEPVSALDVSTQADIINLLMRLQADRGLSILFISHDLSVVRHISDRIAVMYLGEIMEIGPTDKIMTPPHHPYTASLLSSVPTVDSTDIRERIVLDGDVPSPIDPPSGCPFHTRCPNAIPGECDANKPPTKTLETNVSYNCVLDPDELPGGQH